MSVDSEENPISLMSYAFPNENQVTESAEVTQSKPSEIIASKSILKKTLEVHKAGSTSQDSSGLKASFKPIKSSTVQQQFSLPNKPSASHSNKQQHQPILLQQTQQQRLCRAVTKHTLEPERASSRDRRKTVAFGLTTNVDETIEKTQHRFAALRPPSLCTAATTKNTDEVNKLLKDEISALKADNQKLKQNNEELHEELCNLRGIVMEISSRVMRLENASRPVPQSSPAVVDLENTQKVDVPSSTRSIRNTTPPAPFAAIRRRTLPVLSINANAEISNAVKVSTAPQQLTASVPVRTNESSKKNLPAHELRSEVGKVMAMIENRIRQTPEFLDQVRKLFDNNKPSLVPSQQGVIQTSSPYSAKFTRTMTCEQVYSIQTDFPRENYPPLAQPAYSNMASISPYERGAADQYGRSAAGDEEFFDVTITRLEHDDVNHPVYNNHIAYDSSEDNYFDGIDHTARNDTLGRRQLPKTDLRARYRRKI